MSNNGQMISLCTISKNEKAMLSEMLTYYEGIADEFCVVDTGSTDGTLDLEHPKLRIKRSVQFDEAQYPEQFNFADARNEAMDMAKGHWLMLVDTDYRVTPTEWDKARVGLKQHAQHGTDALLMPVITHKAVIPQAVFLRSDRGCRYKNPVHEAPDLNGMHQVLLSGYQIEHFRPHEHMSPDEYRQRHEWYLSLARTYAVANPDDWMTMTIVLRELYALKHFAQHIELAQGFFREFDLRKASADHIARLFLDVASSYAMLGHVEPAIEHARLSLYYSPHSVSAKFTLGELYRHLGDGNEAEMWYREALGSPRPVGGFLYDQPAYREDAAIERLNMLHEQQDGKLWYKDGLRFECQPGCTACCKAAGRVLCPRTEYKQLADAFGVDKDTLLKDYIDDFGAVGLMKMEGGNPICLGATGCLIHKDKPTPCKTFPWWPQVIVSEESWEYIKQQCPGIGKGRLYSVEEIEKARRATEHVRRSWFRGFKQLRQGSSPVLQAHMRTPEPALAEAD